MQLGRRWAQEQLAAGARLAAPGTRRRLARACPPPPRRGCMRHGTITENKYRKKGGKKPSALGKGKAFHKNCYRVKSLPWFQFHLSAANGSGCWQNRGRQRGPPLLNPLRPGTPLHVQAGNARSSPAASCGPSLSLSTEINGYGSRADAVCQRGRIQELCK